jgi:hypothetical protein
MKVISRVDAAKKGLLRYYTGKACAKGHDSERYTANGVCVMCNLENGRNFNQKLRDLRDEARGVVP